MAAHARLKNEFTEDEKYHNLMRWLNCIFTSFQCKRLTEVGEECFIVTVNINNGWVGHFGTLKGDEYIEDRSQIVWDFLKYCRGMRVWMGYRKSLIIKIFAF